MTVKWWKAAGIRAVKTAAQSAIALIGTGTVGFTDLDWIQIASVAGVSAVLSILTSIAGLPELDDGTEENKEAEDAAAEKGAE